MLASTLDFLNSIDSGFEVALQYGATTPINLPNTTESAAFFSRERTENLYKDARLVISHCGIGSIFNSLKYNRPTLIFTRLEKYKEFTDDHQLQIAREIKTNSLLFVHEDNSEDQVQPFLEFYNRSAGIDNEQRDLINYNLATQIADELYR